MLPRRVIFSYAKVFGNTPVQFCNHVALGDVMYATLYHNMSRMQERRAIVLQSFRQSNVDIYYLIDMNCLNGPLLYVDSRESNVDIFKS